MPRAGRSAGTDKSSFESGSDALRSPAEPGLAPGHPSRLPLLPPERAFINTARQRSEPLSGRLSALAAVAGREQGWAEAAGGSLEIAGAGVAEAAGKWQTKLLFVKSGVA